MTLDTSDKSSPKGTLDFSRSSRGRDLLLGLGLAGLGITGGYAAGLQPRETLALVVGVGLIALVIRHPRAAAFVYLVAGPLIVGLERGTVVPFVRLNEILLVALWAGVILGPVRKWAMRGFPRVQVHSVDISVLALAVFSSLTSLTWMFARDVPITLDDALFALTLWKYLALYILVRVTLRTAEDARIAVALVLTTGLVVAALGILQALQVGPVPSLLRAYVAEFDVAEKLDQRNAKSTIGGSIAFANTMAVLTALAVAWAAIMPKYRVVAASAGAVFAIATLTSNQFSGVIGLVTVLLVSGAALKVLGRLLACLIPLAVVGFVVLQSSVQARLAELDPQTGLPLQWTGDTGRIANLQRFFWPELAEGANWLLGVRTSARIQSPEPFRDWIWIESGYTWLLWNGGVPLLLSFAAYVWVACRTCRQVLARHETGIARVAAIASLAGLAQLALLMFVDTHLTMRGAADLLFPLVAITVTAWSRESVRPKGVDHCTQGAA